MVSNFQANGRIGVDLMKTKQEYIDALECMTKEYYSIVRSPEECNRFNRYLRLFKGLVNEHFEEKTETNLERYFDDIGIFGINSFAVTNGKPMRCKDVHCDKCDFGGPCGRCGEERLIWLTSPFKKPPYKLNRFEYDLIKTFDHCKECCLLNEIESLKKLSEKGYFEGINPFTKVHEILENCEVIKDVKG